LPERLYSYENLGDSFFLGLMSVTKELRREEKCEVRPSMTMSL
jgi:hypothetical protein